MSGLFKVSRMSNFVHCVTFQLLLIVMAVSGWKAVPANQAMYSLRTAHYGPTSGLVGHEALPRTYLHSIYKFGWCTPDVIQKQFLSKIANITLSDRQSTTGQYIYLLEEGGTITDSLACIIMKIYVPRPHLFRNSRLPMYYCQGELFWIWKLTYQRIELHEFYLRHSLNLAANFFFEFYHPYML